MNEVIVEYDYVAKESDELTIKKGDIIKDVVKKPGGWWEGILRDKKGMFPDNFVRCLDKDSVILRNNKDVTRIRQCRVVFSYNQDHEDELNLKVGDVIDILGEEEEGWWRGSLNGKEGVFPSNFVKEIQWQPNPSNRISSSNLGNENEGLPPKLPVKPSKQLCEAMYPYKAQNEDELSFKEGDVISLINKDSQDPGWWQGELHGKIGVFPDNFVVLLTNTDNKDSNKDDRKSISRVEMGAIKSMSVASQRKSLEPRIAGDGDSNSLNKTPPIPSKKPNIFIKKSPSGSGGGFISEIKKKIIDVVDGTTSSKIVSKEKENTSENVADNEFDQVERRPLLADVRATRVKAPGRRPPTTTAVTHKDDQPSRISNGSIEGESHDQQATDLEVKPRLREWEKHKAPWLEEMKQNQVKRTMTNSMEEHNISGEDKSIKTQNDKEVESPKSISPLNSKLKFSPQDASTAARVEKPSQVPVRHSLTSTTSTDIPKDIPLVISQTTTAATPTTITTSPTVPKEPDVSKTSPSRPVTISKSLPTQVEIVERLEMLEETVKKQSQLIEDLRRSLQVEVEMRIFLQEKMSQNVQV